jgi:uncharacterized membrane protein YadS
MIASAPPVFETADHWSAAPVIGADSDDIAASISFTAVLGVIVVLTLPLLGCYGR